MENELEKFKKEKENNISSLVKNRDLFRQGIDFVNKTAPYKYTYNFSWMGRPIIAYPQDMVAMQELIWEVKPDLIIETGVAHGGSIVYYASLLELNGGDGIVLGIDIDIRKHNRDLIEAHPMMKRIRLIEGSSTSEEIVKQAHAIAAGKKRVMVCLDSNHTHEHVYNELLAYADLVSVGSYLIVFDTAVEMMTEDFDWGNRPWGKGNNPHTAVMQFLKEKDCFEIDKKVDGKLLITVAPDGYLKRIK